MTAYFILFTLNVNVIDNLISIDHQPQVIIAISLSSIPDLKP